MRIKTITNHKRGKGIYTYYPVKKRIRIKRLKEKKIIAGKNKFKQKELWWKRKSDKENSFISRAEKKLRKVISDIFPNEEIIFNDKKALNFAELDIYLPKRKLAFEYNGFQHYYFAQKFHKTIKDLIYQKRKDEDKKWQCGKKGIALIIISYMDTINEATIGERMDEAFRVSARTSLSNDHQLTGNRDLGLPAGTLVEAGQENMNPSLH